jgi:outer membrane protein assembly factor BamB
MVYTISHSGLVHCLDEQTGAKVWARDIQADFAGQRPNWGYSMSVAIDGDAAIVCPGGPNASVVKLDRQTGETIWAGGGSDVPGYATPIIAELFGLKQYVVFTNVSVIGVQAETGALVWRVPWETTVNVATPLVFGNYIFITSGYGHGCAMVEVTAQGAAIRWENKEIQAHFNSPLGYGGQIYGIGDPGFLVCLDPATGNVLWKQPGFEKGGLCAVDGVLIGLAGDSGAVVMASASPAGYEELGRFTPLGGQSWTAPIVANGRLIVRNRQALASFDLM